MNHHGQPDRISRDFQAIVPTWRVFVREEAAGEYGDIPIYNERYAGKVLRQGATFYADLQPVRLCKSRAEATHHLLNAMEVGS